MPGMHGQKGSLAKPSEYSRQLREKQKLRRLYGITEKQLQNYFDKASAKKEITANALLKLLELRLDNVVYRAGLAKTRAQARQMVNHGLYKVNDKKVSIPSFQNKVGDKIQAIDRIKNSAVFAFLEKQKFAPAKWIKADYANKSAEIARALEPDDLEKVVQTSLVVEYYSK
jgi:small subunit ribosomal protein S4